ncbi:MAG: CopG family antitoxin [Candidatus Erginobacter occultus]|nr:CopG family antitoxin [Candidatus Erginobacter occultus]
MKKETRPNSRSLAEESEFWDEQDATDYFDFDQPVKTKIDIPRKKMVTLRMEPELIVGIKELAARKKQRYQPMIREWIQERYLRESR